MNNHVQFLPLRFLATQPQVDRRIVRLSLTSEGREIVHQLDPVVIAFNERSLHGFSPEQQQTLQEQLRQIVSNVVLETGSGPDDLVQPQHEKN
ncbi:hypothetical protein [Ktedonobacter racemifer]|uniref:Transcriptional regulator, MarR family n=1 Tax=Ktedonobacter racemifer DSM 44963 TaxID=485913 RepID=D6TXJ6_KTERA|nr:hypothetical protein [Ktedonobacter racemifer]EFH84929.1 transcriptional regulator, MarR family [Ktedonobacter racemifer DSM 44963]